MSVPAVNRSLLIGVAGVVLLAGCGQGAGPVPLTGLVLPVAEIPADFQVLPATVEDLLETNERTLKQAKTVNFVPPACAPSADAAFAPQLTADNTVLIAAQSDSATLSEVVTSVRRDIDADRRATTGPCRVVTASPTEGTLAGARIVTTSSELSVPSSPAVEQALVLRSDSVTTLADGQGRARSALLANVLVRRPSGETVTVQFNIASLDTPVAATVPEQVEPPMPVAEYRKLLDEAIASAAR